MKTFVYLLCIILLVASCAKKREDTVIEPTVTTSEPTGSIRFILGSVYKLDGYYQDFKMFPDTGLGQETLYYPTDKGDKVVISYFSYFVHKVVLFKANGDSLPLKDSVFVVKNTIEDRFDNSLWKNIPEGSYTRMTFIIGGLDNPNDVKTLKNKAPELFTSASSYSILRFKGLYQNKDTALAYPTMPSRAWKKIDYTLALHEAAPFQRKVDCPFFAPIVVDGKSSPPYLHIRCDVRALFGIQNQPSSHLIDIAQMPTGIFIQKEAALYANLFASNPQGANLMFVNDHIHPN